MTSARKLLGLMLLAVFSLGVVAHGSAKFKAAASYAVGTKPSAAAVGDFNGDGKLDIAVVNSGDASVGENGGLSILMGNGDGTLKSAANVSAGTNPLAVAVADLNGDARADLLIADSAGIGMLLGNTSFALFLFLGQKVLCTGRSRQRSEADRVLRLVAPCCGQRNDL